MTPTATKDLTTHPPLHPKYKFGSTKVKQIISIMQRQAPDTEVPPCKQNTQQLHFTILILT